MNGRPADNFFHGFTGRDLFTAFAGVSPGFCTVSFIPVSSEIAMTALPAMLAMMHLPRPGATFPARALILIGLIGFKTILFWIACSAASCRVTLYQQPCREGLCKRK
jgi:hypothetical protein